MSTNSNQIEALNKLITTLYDGENGYKEAAEDVDSAALKTRFNSLAKQRYDFGHEIKPFIKGLGGEVDKGGSVAASIHRVWIDLKTAVTGNDEAAVLNECIRGEESAVEAYEEVLRDGGLTGEAHKVVSDQLSKIKQTLSEIRTAAAAYAS